MGGPGAVVVGERVALRPLRHEDAVPLGRFLNDPKVIRYLPPRVRQESGRQFVERVLREQQHGEGRAFAIVAVDSDEVVGQIRFINWSRLERDAEVGCWIGRRYWGKGLGTEAVRLLCRYGFRSMRLHRIHATVVVGNDRSERTLRRAGFRVEGTSRRSARGPHGWRDERMFGLLRDEWVRRTKRFSGR